MKKTNSNSIISILFITLLVFFILGKTLNIPISETLFITTWVLLFTVIVLIHGWETLGLKETIVFFVIAYTVTMLYEYTDAFGWGEWFQCTCIYGEVLGPKFLGKIPYIIPLAWTVSLYCTFTMTNIIFRRIKTKPESEEKTSLKWFLKIFGMGIVAGLMMISWDLINDPVFVNMGAWTWPNGGIYYGIPIWNYLVWIEISVVVYVAFSIYMLKIKKNQVFIGGKQRSGYTLLPVFLYLMVLIFFIIYAIYEKALYAVPWATITMCSVVAVTIFQFYKFKCND
jgi:putative membrane protein